MDGWDYLDEVVTDMIEDEVQESKKRIVKTFMNAAIMPPVNDGFAPVDTGNWIANNVVVYNKPNSESNDLTDKEGISTMIKAFYKVEQSKPFQTVVVQNNTEYNNEVEYSGWYNKGGTVMTTAPYRPYRIALEILRGKLEKL